MLNIPSNAQISTTDVVAQETSNPDKYCSWFSNKSNAHFADSSSTNDEMFFDSDFDSQKRQLRTNIHNDVIFNNFREQEWNSTWTDLFSSISIKNVHTHLQKAS